MRYITLPSNASLNHHPNNTLTEFKTHFPETVSLPQGEFELGLSEISFPNAITFEVPPDTYRFTYGYRGETMTYTIPGGRYSSMRAVFEKMREVLKRPSRVRVLIKSPPGAPLKAELIFENPEWCDLDTVTAKFLGFSGKEPAEEVTGGTPVVRFLLRPYPPKKPSSFFVYCDLVTPQIVGDTSARLLRVVPITAENSEQRHVHVVYNRLHYLPLVTNSFHTAQISIRDEFGNPIPFADGGLVTLTLHIRRRISDAL